MQFVKTERVGFPLNRCRCAVAASSSEPGHSLCIQVSLCIQSKHKPCFSASLMTSVCLSHTHSAGCSGQIFMASRSCCVIVLDLAPGAFLSPLFWFVLRHWFKIHSETHQIILYNSFHRMFHHRNVLW